MDVMRQDMQIVVMKEEDAEAKKGWRRMIHCDYSSEKLKAKQEEEEETKQKAD